MGGRGFKVPGVLEGSKDGVLGPEPLAAACDVVEDAGLVAGAVVFEKGRGARVREGGLASELATSLLGLPGVDGSRACWSAE